MQTLKKLKKYIYTQTKATYDVRYIFLITCKAKKYNN